MKKSNVVPTSIIPKVVNPNSPAQRFAREKVLLLHLAFSTSASIGRLAKRAQAEGSESLAKALTHLAKKTHAGAMIRLKACGQN